MNRVICCLALVVSCLNLSVSAVENPKTYLPDWQYFKGYAFHAGRIISSPARWDSSGWLTAGLVAGTAVGLYSLDGEIRNAVSRSHGGFLKSVSDFTNHFGDGKETIPALGAIYLYGYAANNERARRVALESVESFVLAGAFVNVIKYAAHRKRPNCGDGPYDWSGPGFYNRDVSFPSGHAATAFAVATVFAEEFHDERWVPPLAYGLAAGTGFARIYKDAHWASDVFVGGAVGYFTARAVISYGKDEKRTAALLPIISGDGAGAAVACRF